MTELITWYWMIKALKEWNNNRKRWQQLLEEGEEMALRFKNEEEFNKWVVMNKVKVIEPMPEKVEKNLTAHQDKNANWLTGLWITFAIIISLIIASMF